MNDLPTGPIKVLRTRMRANKIANAAWRTGIFIVGFLLVIVGIVLLVLPGPGWLLIFIGFLTLATEFAWASRAILKTKSLAASAADKVGIPLWAKYLIAALCTLASLILIGYHFA